MTAYANDANAISRETAEVPLDDLEAPAGIIEAIELYESAMTAYSAAQGQLSYTITISSSSSTGEHMSAI
ncbi:MAG: hypothetical protein OXE93_09475 [bacterium]|nr:hypothetical protein [bacterium]MCY4164422.1 hypothetical protein [bacterium]MCY4258069.1 hypothetical protein [bacterium]